MSIVSQAEQILDRVRAPRSSAFSGVVRLCAGGWLRLGYTFFISEWAPPLSKTFRRPCQGVITHLLDCTMPILVKHIIQSLFHRKP